MSWAIRGAASNPFTLEMIGQKIESHSSKRIVLDVDGRLIVLSFFGLQGTDIDAPQEQLLKAFEKIDTEISELEARLSLLRTQRSDAAEKHADSHR